MTNENSDVRLPPQSVEAEQALLGCVLIENSALPKVISKLQPDSFNKPAHSKINQAMLDLLEKNESIDTISVVDKLQKNGELENVGGAYYISGLSTETASSENAEYYSQIVSDKATLRNIIKTLDEWYEKKD